MDCFASGAKETGWKMIIDVHNYLCMKKKQPADSIIKLLHLHTFNLIFIVEIEFLVNGKWSKPTKGGMKQISIIQF